MRGLNRIPATMYYIKIGDHVLAVGFILQHLQRLYALPELYVSPSGIFRYCQAAITKYSETTIFNPYIFLEHTFPTFNTAIYILPSKRITSKNSKIIVVIVTCVTDSKLLSLSWPTQYRKSFSK